MTVTEALALAKCIDCLERGEKETLMALGGLAASNLDVGQISSITQVAKSVTTSNTLLLAAAAAGVTRKFVTMQNLGTVKVFVRTQSGASNVGANGEWALEADTDSDGKGGFITLDGYSGALYAAAGSGTQQVQIAYADQ